MVSLDSRCACEELLTVNSHWLNFLVNRFLRRIILEACGATVKTLSDIQKGKGRLSVDCCLLASTSLPPHSVSMPTFVSAMMQHLADDVPYLDLAWAHQSIIQRRCLPLVGDARYAVALGYSMSNTCKVSSIKSKDGVRYEIGDLVQFTRGSKAMLSAGRIVDITFESQGRSFRLEIQLLVRRMFIFDFDSVFSRFLSALTSIYNIRIPTRTTNWLIAHQLQKLP